MSATAAVGLWRRWNGPYIETPPSPSIGTFLGIATSAGGAFPYDFDLDFDGNTDEITAAQQFVIISVDVGRADYERVNRIIDGNSEADPDNMGKVNYAGGVMSIYLAHN